jgi:uncharacterized heparinase superfamily protein
MGVDDLGPLWRMTRRVPPRQLVRRAALAAKRRVRVRVERTAPGRLHRPPDAAVRSLAEWPRPVLPPRTHLVEGDRALVLDRRLPTTTPFDWTPEWAPAGTLGRIRLHEHEWLEGVSDQAFGDLIEDWIHRVPPYGPAYWNDAWNSYALSLRVVVWMQQLARRADALPAGQIEAMTESLALQLGFLARNLETDVGGNHLLKNIKALLWGAACFDGPAPAAWHRRAAALLERELRLQVPDDGLHFEGSPAYHLQCFADLIEIHSAMSVCPLRDALTRALDRMAFAAAVTSAPDGRPLLLGDGGLDMAYSAEVLIDAWEAAGGERPQLPEVVALADAGLYTWRADGDLVVVDAGPFSAEALPAHGHADVLSFTWVLAGRRFIVDAGVYEYQGPTRARSRSTAAHNTVTLDDHDQAELFGVFRAGRRWTVTRHAWNPRADGFVLAASHDGYAHLDGAPTHRRTVDVKGRRIRVEDRILGGAGQAIVARLMLHPDVQVERTATGATLTRDDLVVELRTEAEVRVVPAPWWPNFGETRPTHQLELHYGTAPGGGGFLLQVTAHSSDTAPAPPRAEDLGA